MKQEALKLADEIEDSGKLMIYVGVTGGEDIVKAADTIRKLVAELDKQGEPVAYMSTFENDSAFDKFRFVQDEMYPTPVYTAPQTNPLSDADICWLWVMCEKDGTQATYVNFARAIEERILGK